MTNTYLILTKAKWESALPAKLKKLIDYLGMSTHIEMKSVVLQEW